MTLPNPVTTANPPRTLNLVVGLIRDYLGLAADQVVVYNQKWRIPTDARLYVSVGYLAIRPFAPSCQTEEFTDSQQRRGLKEVVTLNSQETLSINVYSRGQIAIDRKDEVIMAFGSTAAQQLCEANSIKLGRLPLGFTDLSQVEGTAILNRFAITINALVARKQERVIEYFDTFQTTGLTIEP